MTERRKVTRIVGDSAEAVEMMDLRENDIFSLEEPNGKYIGKFSAAGDPYLNQEGVATILVNNINE